MPSTPPPVTVGYPDRPLPAGHARLTQADLDAAWSALTAILACDLDPAGSRPRTALRDALRALDALHTLTLEPTWEDAV